MAIRNPHKEELRRLESKTLDARFKTAVREGLNCSPFEADAVLGVVREVYSPLQGYRRVPRSRRAGGEGCSRSTGLPRPAVSMCVILWVGAYVCAVVTQG